MANWSKLQEDLVGLPVAKRARHGIHFQKGANEFVANFSGKPCHYEDGGIWKPIDTGLLATADGWYSSPHSDVLIHPDGRVKVKNSTYQQFAELPSAKTGVLSGDRIIRTFPGGEQHLIMKEDGFREEIHVFKPTFPLEKFIAKTTGNLPSKYKAHPITAIDANDDTYTFTGDVVAFGKWLDAAKYPVVIDPDISVNTGVGGDTFVRSGSTSNFGTSVELSIYHNGATGLRKALIRFDLSSIDSGATCTAGTMKLFLKDAWVSTARYLAAYKIADANGDWIEGTSASPAQAGAPTWAAKVADGSGGVTTAWAGSDGLSTAGTDFVNTVHAQGESKSSADAGSEYDLTFSADGLAVLQDWFGDATNNGFLIMAYYGSFGLHSGESATESYRPVLTVTYTSGTFIPINMNAQMQSLVGGMRG